MKHRTQLNKRLNVMNVSSTFIYTLLLKRVLEVQVSSVEIFTLCEIQKLAELLADDSSESNLLFIKYFA